tara:strand:- start:6012 stop:6503 length:492 start_codon:yes stop_codon:yes gene_type:complete
MGMTSSTKWTRKRRRKEILLYKELHPLKTLKEIGEHFGVTKQYIYKFLKQNNIVQGKTKRRKNSRPIKYCPVCGERTPLAPYGKYYYEKCPKCSYRNKILKLHCAFCKVPFDRKKAIIRDRYKNGFKMNYCSVSCFYKGLRDGLSKRTTKAEYYKQGLAYGYK